MGAWLPIETAPKDGTQIWAFCPQEDPAQVVLSFGWIDVPRDHADFWEGWLYADETLCTRVPEEPEPTHWMPLPEGPVDA